MTLLYRQLEHGRILNAALVQMRERIGELEKLVDSDTLTPLYNRRRFIRELQATVEATRAGSRTASVMFIDMDGLKSINDSHGHGAGDAALVEVAQILLNDSAPGDLVARIGGDEFAILMPDTGYEDAFAAAERICRAVKAHEAVVGDVRLELSVSVGVAELRPGDNVDTLLSRADEHMYACRREARSN